MDGEAATDAVRLRGVEYKWTARDEFGLSIDQFEVARGSVS